MDVTTPGDYDVAYSASNGYVTTTVHRTVHVRDTVKPAITGFSLTPDSLWSPNHKLVDVVAQYSVTDASNRAACSLTAGSNELANDLGDGNTAVDVVVATCTICSCGRARARGTLATLTWTDSSGNVVSLSTSLSMMNDE